MTFVNGREEVEQEDFRADLIKSLNELEIRAAKLKSDLTNIVESASSALTLLDTRSAVKTEVITTANATDLATAITLVNEIKTKLNLMNS